MYMSLIGLWWRSRETVIFPFTTDLWFIGCIWMWICQDFFYRFFFPIYTYSFLSCIFLYVHFMEMANSEFHSPRSYQIAGRFCRSHMCNLTWGAQCKSICKRPWLHPVKSWLSQLVSVNLIFPKRSRSWGSTKAYAPVMANTMYNWLQD